MPAVRPPAEGRAPRLYVAYPQVFVADVERSAGFYAERLGFSIVYLYGTPPFYGLVERDGIGLNLRHVGSPVVESSLREREILLSANIVAEGIKELFAEFRGRGVEFAQSLKLQPWGATDFIVRDLDGNLLCFASPVRDSGRN